jgi:hypothetical protein
LILVIRIFKDIRDLAAVLGPDDFAGDGLVERGQFENILAQERRIGRRGFSFPKGIVNSDAGKIGSQKLDDIPGQRPQNLPLAKEGVDLQDGLDLMDHPVDIFFQNLVLDPIDQGREFLLGQVHSFFSEAEAHRPDQLLIDFQKVHDVVGDEDSESNARGNPAG